MIITYPISTCLITWTIVEVWIITEKLITWNKTPWTERLLGKLISLNLFQALGESSRQLLACASERAQVLELLPSSGCAGTHSTTDHTFMQTHPNNPFTPSMYRQTVLQLGGTDPSLKTEPEKQTTLMLVIKMLVQVKKGTFNLL